MLFLAEFVTNSQVWPLLLLKLLQSVVKNTVIKTYSVE